MDFESECWDLNLTLEDTIYRVRRLFSFYSTLEHYEKFLDLWKDADPGLLEVEDARNMSRFHSKRCTRCSNFAETEQLLP